MTSKRCDELMSESLLSLRESRLLRLPEWEQAYVNRLNSLGNAKERILTREAKEAAQKASGT